MYVYAGICPADTLALYLGACILVFRIWNSFKKPKVHSTCTFLTCSPPITWLRHNDSPTRTCSEKQTFNIVQSSKSPLAYQHKKYREEKHA